MKTVVITGSTRGLGYEMARKFCQEGFNVIINGVNPGRLITSNASAFDSEKQTLIGSI